MGRPNRRRAGGRVTPKKSRPRYDDDLGADFTFHDHEYKYEVQAQIPDEEPDGGLMLEMLVRDAAHLLDECAAMDAPDIDEADRWASSIQCGISTTWSPDGLPASAVLSHAAREGGPAGALLAAAVAVYGPPNVRGRANGVLDRIIESSADVPAWVGALGQAVPVRARRVTDQWGEHGAVVVDYARPDGSVHMLSVEIHAFCKGMAHSFSLDAAAAGSNAAGSGPAETHLRGNDDGAGTLDDPGTLVDPGDLNEAIEIIEEMGLADARATVEAALRVHDEILSAADDDDEPGMDQDLRALVRQRIGLLATGGRPRAEPAPGIDETADAIRSFASQPVRLGEHAEELGDMLHATVRFAMMCHDSDILRWTPLRVSVFIEEWIPEHGSYCDECDESHESPSDEKWLTTVEAAFPRWLRFAAERKGIPDGALDANLATARRSLRQMRVRVTGSPVRLALP